MDTAPEFWDYLDRLVAASRIVVERRRGTADPDWPGTIYPADYGYLDVTRASDGAAIDAWVGGGGAGRVQGAVCTVDLLKRDAEVKVVMGCSEDELQRIVALLNVGQMRAILVRRPSEDLA